MDALDLLYLWQNLLIEVKEYISLIQNFIGT